MLANFLFHSLDVIDDNSISLLHLNQSITVVDYCLTNTTSHSLDASSNSYSYSPCGDGVSPE